ncbi:hypothetical protein NHG32_02340 [Aerococcaceae bacterium NML191219]|nr:hypothetical protein [Aerococcaceae bacterium NML191219]
MMDEVFKILGTIGLKDETKKPLDDALAGAEKTASGIGSKFVGAAKVIAGAFAAKQIFDFGAMAVEAAAGAKATQAQFEQVFDGIVEGAQEKLDGLAKEVGALPNRLKPSFNSIASFAKVAGMDTQESLDFTTRAMKAAADTSAFMDKSLEETTETLKSYLKGNFSVADNLGILSTETTRNAKATELFGQKYSELSGIQQQEVLLQMYEDANKVSGAMGQAARESDGFENVMGNMKQAWQDFIAIVGSAILPLAVKAIQALTAGIQFAGEALKPITEAFSKWLETIGDGVSGGPLSQLTEWFSSFKDSAMAFIEPIIVAFDALYDILFGSKSVKENTDLLESLGFSQEAIDFVRETGEAFQAVIDLVVDGFNGAMVVVDAFFDMIFGTQSSKENFDLMTMLGIPPDVANLVVTMGETMRVVLDSIVGGVMSLGQTAVEFWTNHIMPVLKEVTRIIRDQLTKNKPLLNGLAVAFKLVGQFISRTIDSLVKTIQFWVGVIGWAVDFIRPLLENIAAHFLNYFAIILNIINLFIAVFTGDWDSAWQAVQNIIEAAWNLITNWIDGVLTFLVTLFGDFLKGVIQWGTDIYNSVVEWFGKIPGEIEKLWNDAIKFLEEIDLFEIGANIIQGLIDGVVSMGQGLIDSVMGPVNDAINGVKNFLQIKSPSQKFRDEVGKMIPQGIAVGVEQDAHLVQESLDEVAGKLAFDPKLNYQFKASTTQGGDTQQRVWDYIIRLLEVIAGKDPVLVMDGHLVAETLDPHAEYIDAKKKAMQKKLRGER